MYKKTALYFVPLRFSRHERSVAPSKFNIKAQGLAHYLRWVKLGLDKVYWLYFNDNMVLSNGRTCKKYLSAKYR